MDVNRSSERKDKLEACISKFRAEVMKDLADIQADFDSEKQPKRDAFNILEAVFQTDPRSRAEFEASAAADETLIKGMSDGVMAAFNAMEKQMRADYELHEQRIRERGESFDNLVFFTKSYTIGDYAQNLPNNEVE